MNIEFLLYAKFESRRVIPTRSRLFSAIVSSLNDAKINPLIFLSESSVIENGKTLIYSFHPAADPVYFEIKNDILQVTISTGAFGAGYHMFIINILDRIARRIDVKWEEDSNHKDPSGYFKDRDFKLLKDFFIKSLSDYAKLLMSHHEKGFSNFMVSMPYDYPIIEKEYFALSSLGYWGKSWFSDLINSEVAQKDRFAEEFFIWNGEDMDGSFWFKSALSIIWLYFPFREIIDDNEKNIYQKIIYSFEEAYKSDSSLPYPWDILISVAKYLDDDNLVELIESRKTVHHSQINIGFRKETGRYSIAGGFTVSLPMRMNVYKNDRTLVEFKDINLYAAFQVYSFEQKDTDIIMEYVVKQLEEADEDKGEKIDIKLDGLEGILYEKEMDSGEYMLTAAIVASKLALLSWFTYDSQSIKEKCIEAIKSIKLDK